MESLPKGLELSTVTSKRRRHELPLGRKHSNFLDDTKSSPTFKTPPSPVKALSIITTPKKNSFASDTVVPRYTRSVVSADKSIKLVSWNSRNNRARISRRPSEKSRINRGNSGKSRPQKSTEATVEKSDEISNKTHNDKKSKAILETSSTTSTAEKTNGVFKIPSQNISEKSTKEISEEFSKPTTEETSGDKSDMIVDSAERVCIEHEPHITVPEHKYKCKKLRVRLNRSIVRKYGLNLRKPKTTAIFPTPMSKTSEITRTGTKSRTPTKHANSLASMLLRALNSPSIPPPPPSPSGKPITSTTSAGTSLNMQELHSKIATRSKALSLSLASTIQQQQTPALGYSILDNSNHEEAMATTTSGSHCDESFLLTPLKTTSPALSVRQQTQQQQQQPQQQKRSARLQQLTQKQIAKELIPTISSTPTTQTTKEQLTSTTTTTLSQQQTYFLPVEPKKEFDDEQTSAAVAGQSLSALMIGGVPAEIVDNSGTRSYSFLHPAKYNRSHGVVLLDYCCSNLDGPMPAIDPTREHSQVQTLVRELPAYIVMSTKVITRADLEAKNNSIPESIRKKMGKLNSMPVSTTSSDSLPLLTPFSAMISSNPVGSEAVDIKIPGKNLAASGLPALPQKTPINVSGGNISKHLPKVTSANVTTTPHLSTSTSFSTPSTVTTTQRVTRHAAASKSEQILIITKDTDGSVQTTGNPDECILPDDERDAVELKEIKRELDDLLTGGR